MPFHSIEPRRLYRQIADQIRTLIKSGEFPAGARLPPERDLAKQLGVSRPSVREALIALEVEGLVEVRIGSGIYVQPGNEDAGVGDAHEAEAGPYELLRARYVIEAECAALAAKSAKKPQLVAISDALEEMQREWRRASTIRSTAIVSFTCALPKRPATAPSSRSSRCCGWSAPALCISSSSTITTRPSCGKPP
jgi:DNA-binding FadR family transcriptional regulator